MADDIQDYVPAPYVDSIQYLSGNHFKFTILGLPDLTFYCQSVTVPSVAAAIVKRANPFVNIPETADHLEFSTFDVTFLLDNSMKAYFSLLYWLKGYGFPDSYDQLGQFAAHRTKEVPIGRPTPRDIRKTSAILSVLQPDTNTTVAEFKYTDIFPISLSQISFTTTSTDAPTIGVTAQFACETFDLVLTSES